MRPKVLVADDFKHQAYRSISWDTVKPALHQKCTRRVSTNLTEQISRRFTEDSRRDFKKNPGHVCTASA